MLVKIHFSPPRRKNIVYDKGKTLILLVWLSLLGHQTSHSQNNIFFPRCTIYYFLPSSGKINRMQHGRKKFILRVWSLMSEQSEGNNDTSKINFFLPWCIILYCATRENKIILQVWSLMTEQRQPHK